MMSDRAAARERRLAPLALAILLASLRVGAGAASAESPGADPEPFSLVSLGVKGTATLKNFSHFETTRTDREHFRDEGILQLEWGRRLAPWSDAKLVVDVRGDDDDFTRGVTFQVQEKNERRSILNLKEAVVGFRGGRFETTFGKQIFAWGTADAYNPTDNINPYDYLDVIDNEKLGVYSAAARATAGATSLVFVVVPVFVPSRVPLPRSRWTPELPAGFVGVLDNREVPPPDIDNMQYAARLRTTLKGVDFSASYYDGFEHTPVVRQSSVAVPPSVVLPRFTPVFTRIKVAGVDFSTTYRTFEFHGEGAFRFVESNGRDDRFQGIAGFNYTWDELPIRRLDQIVVVLEYGREEILASRARSGILELGTLPQFGDLLAKNAFRDAVVGRILLKFTEDTQLKLSGALDLVGRPNHYLQLKLAHKLTDALHVETGLDFFTGPPRTFWGRWRDNDRFFFLMKYFF